MTAPSRRVVAKPLRSRDKPVCSRRKYASEAPAMRSLPHKFPTTFGQGGRHDLLSLSVRQGPGPDEPLEPQRFEPVDHVFRALIRGESGVPGHLVDKFELGKRSLPKSSQNHKLMLLQSIDGIDHCFPVLSGGIAHRPPKRAAGGRLFFMTRRILGTGQAGFHFRPSKAPNLSSQHDLRTTHPAKTSHNPLRYRT